MQAPRTLGRVLEGSIDSFQTFLWVFPLADIYVPQVHSWVNSTHPFMATHHHLTMQSPFFLVWIIFTSYFHLLFCFPSHMQPFRCVWCVLNHTQYVSSFLLSTLPQAIVSTVVSLRIYFLYEPVWESHWYIFSATLCLNLISCVSLNTMQSDDQSTLSPAMHEGMRVSLPSHSF